MDPWCWAAWMSMVWPWDTAGEDDDDDDDASRWPAEARDIDGCRDSVGLPALTDSNWQSLFSLWHVEHFSCPGSPALHRILRCRQFAFGRAGGGAPSVRISWSVEGGPKRGVAGLLQAADARWYVSLFRFFSEGFAMVESVSDSGSNLMFGWGWARFGSKDMVGEPFLPGRSGDLKPIPEMCGAPG